MKRRNYTTTLTALVNRKGVLDIDTVKGCTFGMQKYPKGGCYGLCYAAKVASYYGLDFSKSIIRNEFDQRNIEKTVIHHSLPWFRIGTMGDPSYSWDFTVKVCEWLGKFKVPVVVTKHWIAMSENHASILRTCGAVVNTSVSPLDTEAEIEYRINMFKWLKKVGVNSVLRIVSVKFGDTYNGRKLEHIQDIIFQNSPIIDNPLRIPSTDSRVMFGDILVCKHRDLRGNSTVSISKSNAYLGPCNTCPDQ